MSDRGAVPPSGTVPAFGISPKSIGPVFHMNWKYVLAILIALVSASAFVSLSDSEVSDADDPEEDTATSVSGVTYRFDPDTGTLTVSGVGDMADYSYGTAPWYPYRYQIRSIVIEDGVTSVGGCAFFACEAVESVTLGKDVTKIQYSAFYSCGSLKEITIPDTVTYIGDSAFSGCDSLISITVPDNVTYLGYNVFDGCTSLETAFIGRSVAYIGGNAFDGCSSLRSISVSASNTVYTSDEGVLIGDSGTVLMVYPRQKDSASYTVPSTVITIEDLAFYHNAYLTSVDLGSVVTIGQSAFLQCSALAAVNIPDTVTIIDYQAFCDCSSLRTIHLGSSVMIIGDNALNECDSLESITVSGSNTWYSSINGVLLNGDGTILIQYPVAKKDPAYTVPSSVKTIGEYAFRGCTELSSVNLGSVEVIGSNAFTDCPYLTSVEFSSVKTIGDGAFYQCTSLNTVAIPDTAEYIGSNAFYHCTALSSVSIGKNVQYVETDAFCHCTFLSSITVDPGNPYFSSTDNMLIRTGDNTLIYCAPAAAQTSVTIPDTVKAIGPRAFEYCANLESIVIPDSVKSIAHYAFKECSSLVSIEIPFSVTSMGFRLFDGCTSLKSIDYRTAVDGVLFSKDGTQLLKYPAASEATSYTIPDGISMIDIEAFCGADSLTSITIPDSVVYIGSSVFDFCTSLVSINVNPGNMVYCSIDGVLFEKDLFGDPVTLVAYPAAKTDTSYTVPSTVTSISDDAFFGCRYLQSLTLPDSVGMVGDICYCTALKTVHFGSSTLYIGGFEHCTALESVTVSEDNIIYTAVDGVLYNKDLTYLMILPPGKTGTLEIGAEVYLNKETLVNGNSLTAFKVAEGNEYYASVDGVLFSKDLKTLIAYPGAKEGTYTIPEGTETIGSHAFVKCSLTSLTFAGSVRTVSESAIVGDVSMFGLDIPGCSLLKKIVINSGLRFVDGDSFENISFGDGVPVASAYIAGKSFVMNDNGEMVVEVPADTYVTEFMIAIATIFLLAGIGMTVMWKKKA